MKIFSSGADWLTVTNVLDDYQVHLPLMTAFLRLAAVEKEWKSAGYKGLQCLDTEMKYGSRLRDDGRADEMLVSPGAHAGVLLEHMKNIDDYRVTRLDLQVTVFVDKPDENIAVRLYDKLSRMSAVGTSPLGRRKVSLVRSETGQTLYIGSRQTGRKFFRLYDKSHDVGASLGQVWRQEVQYGRDLAQGAAKWYVQAANKGQSVIDLVCAEFMDCADFSLVPTDEVVAEDFAEKPADHTVLGAKVEWLRKCVRPTIALLIEHDLLDEAKEALGLRLD